MKANLGKQIKDEILSGLEHWRAQNFFKNMQTIFSKQFLTQQILPIFFTALLSSAITALQAILSHMSGTHATDTAVSVSAILGGILKLGHQISVA